MSTLSQIIKEWNAELQERTGKFRKQANAIAEWDRKILRNRDILLQLEVLHYLLKRKKKIFLADVVVGLLMFWVCA